jgi:hypothetical protein
MISSNKGKEGNKESPFIGSAQLSQPFVVVYPLIIFLYESEALLQ